MTIKKLEQYPYLQAKIKRIRDEIEELKGDWAVCGKVMTSGKSLPYAPRELIIGDRDTTQEARYKIIEKRSELECAISDKAEIEQFINSIEDVPLKEIFTFRYIYGEKCEEVAAHFGYKETGKTISKKIERYLKSLSPMSPMS